MRQDHSLQAFLPSLSGLFGEMTNRNTEMELEDEVYFSVPTRLEGRPRHRSLDYSCLWPLVLLHEPTIAGAGSDNRNLRFTIR